MKSFVAGRPYWWQWPTILSLDAPCVAVLWQWILGESVDAPTRAPEAFVLGCSVWLAYTADRWIEGWRVPAERLQTQRHFFARRWRWAIVVFWLVVLGFDVAVAKTKLSQREFDAGLILLAATALYLLSHQLIHRRHPWRMPKEICVAALLGAGVGLFVFAQPGITLTSISEGLALFGLLAFTNCLLISVWEADVDAAQGQSSLVRQMQGSVKLAHLLPWAVSLLGAFLAWRSSTAFLPLALCATASALSLGVLDRAENFLGRQLARVLADVVLMTPGVVFLGKHFQR